MSCFTHSDFSQMWSNYFLIFFHCGKWSGIVDTWFGFWCLRLILCCCGPHTNTCLFSITFFGLAFMRVILGCIYHIPNIMQYYMYCTHFNSRCRCVRCWLGFSKPPWSPNVTETVVLARQKMVTKWLKVTKWVIDRWNACIFISVSRGN